jgi:hypothetical protein
MRTQIDNILMSSMILWMDNKILSKGEAFTNYGSLFYESNNSFNDLKNFTLPFRQIVADSSITNANILSGVYIDGEYSAIGENGFSGIDPYKSTIYLNDNINYNEISGNYAVKDFNIYLASDTEEKILFETQYKIRPKTSQNPTGISNDSITYPAIFLKHNYSRNKPFSFGGEDMTSINIRAYILADNLFSLDAVNSILRDTNSTYVPLINDFPTDSFGCINNGYYNYHSLYDPNNISNMGFYISEVNISKLDRLDNELNPKTYSSIIYFTLENIRHPRS